jgi:hypothetical protein
MNQSIFSFFFCIVTTFCYGQHEVTIIDFLTKTPVSYATVNFYSNGEILGGNYCDENGNIVIPKFKKEIDRIGVSCIGYENDNFDFKTTSSSVFHLKPQKIELNEVIISQKKPIALVNYSKIIKSPSRLSRFQKEVVFIPNNQLLQGVLKTFSFKLSKKVKVDQIVRIHVYAKSDLKFEPGVSLLNDNVIKSLPKGTNGVVEIDLLPYAIALPKEGFFIGLESIGRKSVNDNLKYNETDDDEKLYFYMEETNDFKTFINFNSIKENSFWLNFNAFIKEDMKKSFNKDLKIGSNPAFNVTIIPN